MGHPRGAQALATGPGVKLPDNKNDYSRMMHCLTRGSRADETARSSRVICVCGAVTISVLLTTEVLESARVVGKRRWAKISARGCNTTVRAACTSVDSDKVTH